MVNYMVKLKIVYKKSHKTLESSFRDFGELQEIIKKIKPSDMAIKDYYLDYSLETTMFLYTTYRPEFFSVHEDGIHLNVIGNGVRRTRKYAKQPNNNATLARVIEKISQTLLEELGKLGIKSSLTNNEPNEARFHYITIELEDLKDNKQHFKGKCIICFDKYHWSWNYNFVEINTPRVKEILDVIKNVFDKKTNPTKFYRGKKRENRTE